MLFSEKILKLRRMRGLSQDETAELIGVSRQALSRWETGTALPDASNIAKICRVFDVSADYLLNDEEQSDALYKPSGRNDGGVALGCILVNVFALLAEIVSVVCAFFSQYVALWCLFGAGVVLTLISVCVFETCFYACPAGVKARFRKKFYTASVWLAALFPLVIPANAAFGLIAANTPGGFTVPVISISFICLAVYIVIGVVVMLVTDHVASKYDSDR